MKHRVNAFEKTLSEIPMAMSKKTLALTLAAVALFMYASIIFKLS